MCWIAGMVTGVLFGLVNISNSIGGAASLYGVMMQMVGAIALVMCLAAL